MSPLTIGFGRSFNQRNIPILAVEIKMSVRVTKRCRSQRPFLPFHLARPELGAEQCLASRAIQVLTDLHRSANCGRKFRFEVHLLRLDSAFFDLQLDQPSASASSGAIDVTVASDRRRD